MKTQVQVKNYLESGKKCDYNNNYVHLKSAFKGKETCKENYCKYIAHIFNIYNEFLHVCTGTNEKRCPVYWNDFKKNFEEASKIETQCKEVYDKLGFYKIRMDWGEQGIEEYIEQYESEHRFSFIEKMIGYNIKNILSKSIHFSKYSVLPILFILLFSFFLKKLSLFGSNIRPRVDDLRKMWRNVQGVTNPETLLNSGKPPSGGNKMG
ncbi:hypothetical protein POWCR01_000193500 [Plasmodium ovale]|uniref:PIR protein n=1 Tax=Plasmodium ovale TaxID=36330 RepID=A0A1C3KJX0_PLAOA|nr:hypothetical protein POWCR01_000193500 [Plasmodium ovale]